MTDFDKILDREYHYYLHLKRLYSLQMNVLNACSGRTIKNDLVYQQMLFASIDGLFVRLINYRGRLLDLLTRLKNNHLDRFKKNNKKGLTVSPEKISNFGDSDPHGSKFVSRVFTAQMKQNFDKVYDRLFPGVKLRAEGRPNHADFDLLSKELVKVFAPIKTHRDTVVAHWDEKQEPATVEDLKKAMEHIEVLLRDLYYVSKLGSLTFELGGVAASVTRTSGELADLILGEHRTRKATTSEMDHIYMMGFDAWTDGQSEEKYLEGCQTSPKYAKGTRYVLEDSEGKAISSLITYDLDSANGKPAIGIGSIATEKMQRKKGFAGQLLWDVINLFFERDGSRVFFLYSDIGPKYYEQFGFIKLPEQFQIRDGSLAMMRCSNEVREILLADPSFQPPGYF